MQIGGESRAPRQEEVEREEGEERTEEEGEERTGEEREEGRERRKNVDDEAKRNIGREDPVLRSDRDSVTAVKAECDQESPPSRISTKPERERIYFRSAVQERRDGQFPLICLLITLSTIHYRSPLAVSPSLPPTPSWLK